MGRQAQPPAHAPGTRTSGDFDVSMGLPPAGSVGLSGCAVADLVYSTPEIAHIRTLRTWRRTLGHSTTIARAAHAYRPGRTDESTLARRRGTGRPRRRGTPASRRNDR